MQQIDSLVKRPQHQFAHRGFENLELSMLPDQDGHTIDEFQALASHNMTSTLR